ncbi:zinc finger protein 600-like isoform X6 [Pieris napi]|uniref:zinc finger protein 600-like isoform X6 n=1 Tax=Pieris napi TaxID=78633 RepID=UPI001FB8E6C1|nr:zinc finger protein 600-like isoform X6 [Pieris napi]
MEFDDVIVKENPGLCRCCLSEGCYKELATEYIWMGENEVYADMLLECFDISISQNNEGPNGTNRLICEVCITRLRDACNFKKQVLECEKKFVDMVGRGDFKQRVTVDILFEEDLKLEQNAEEQSEDTGNFDFLEEPMAFDDEINDDVTAEPLPVKGKRGRPKKSIKTVKKKEEKPKTSKAKGAKRQDMAEDIKSYSSTKRNRLMKKNAVIILESSTVIPFKWHRHKYLCFFCHRPFKDIGTLKEHTKVDHEKSSVQSAVSYLKRDEKVKIDVLNTRCRLCDQKLDDLNDIVEHSRSEHNKVYNEFGLGVVPYKLEENVFKCAECQETFEYFIKLNQHMNKHYGDYVCELCGKSFLSQDRLRCHSLSHGSAFHCNLCSETFDSLTQRNNHERKVHNKDKSIKCFYCAETFQNYTLRKKHHNFVHNIEGPDIKCPVCQKSFQILSKMRVHLKEVHLREKNFACTVCGQKFFSRTHVQKHMIKHSGERVHECSICKKAYARKQTLKDHMRIHNDKKYVCPVCNQMFAQNNSLRLHMKVHSIDSL